MGIWSTIWRSNQETWALVEFPASVAPPDNMEPGKYYLSVWVRSWNIPDSRRGFNAFYPAVHSSISMPHRSGPRAEVETVVVPKFLAKAGGKLKNRVLGRDQCVFGPAPYIGGTAKFEIGVFSVKESDLAQPFLSVLETMSKVAGVGYFELARPFVAPIRQAMDDVAGDGGAATLELGSMWQEGNPKLGIQGVVLLPVGSPELKRLSLDPKNHALLLDGRPSALPYFIWELVASNRRHDYQSIPELARVYNDMMAAARANKDAKEALAQFRRVVLSSNDLIDDDAVRIADEGEAKARKVMGGPGLAARATSKTRGPSFATTIKDALKRPVSHLK